MSESQQLQTQPPTTLKRTEEEKEKYMIKKALYAILWGQIFNYVLEPWDQNFNLPVKSEDEKKRKEGLLAILKSPYSKIESLALIVTDVRIVSIGMSVPNEKKDLYLDFIGKAMGSIGPARLFSTFKNSYNITVHVMYVRGQIKNMTLNLLKERHKDEGFIIMWYMDALTKGLLNEATKTK